MWENGQKYMKLGENVWTCTNMHEKGGTCVKMWENVWTSEKMAKNVQMGLNGWKCVKMEKWDTGWTDTGQNRVPILWVFRSGVDMAKPPKLGLDLDKSPTLGPVMAKSTKLSPDLPISALKNTLVCVAICIWIY